MTFKKPSSVHRTADLFTREHGRISRFLRLEAYGGDAVEDIVEETFQMLKAANKLDVMQDPEHYLFSMAHRALRAHEDERSQSEVVGNVDGAQLLAALRALPKSLLTPLLLTLSGMTHHEIADRLGLSVSATRDRLERAQAQLVHCIKQVEA